MGNQENPEKPAENQETKESEKETPQEEFNNPDQKIGGITPEPSIKKEEPELDDSVRLPTKLETQNFKFGPYLNTLTFREIQQIEEEEGMLPVQLGLGALAELRRIKWYQHIGLNTPFLPDICRLIRGLA